MALCALNAFVCDSQTYFETIFELKKIFIKPFFKS